ncbi:FIST C-terminal domain-containing protein [Fusibacter paucivorans]|uniref:FIST C-terminal domain-containing protein n=1 Tax=Fusibacter paucivorans TaxID=76009 RepID=A0ABS5PU49_9FIRM|nr:FIST N-terminal domain-containing protein [Fusibacter paucivorans]MBS7528447.1 FIST C-terminal domain-containing protein [Fusibacter paucivorans]
MKSLLFSTVEEAISHIENYPNEGYVLHVPISLIHKMSEKLTSDVVLCSTSGEYSANGYKNGSITGFSFDKAVAEIVEIVTPPIKSKQNLETAYQKVKNNKNAFMLLLLDGLSGLEESVISTLFFIDKSFKIIGGSAGDDLLFKETAIYIGKKRVKHVAIFFDMHKRTQLLKENIYVPYGDKLLITSADPIGRTVKTINGEPAATAYAKALSIPESQLADHFMNNPLGKIYEDEVLIASPMKINGDKSITFYCQMMPNTFVYLLKPVNPVDKLENTLDTLNFRPSFLYVINCILRSLKFQQDGTWEKFDATVLNTCPNTTGFISYGEQFYTHHVNQTMVMLAVE